MHLAESEDEKRSGRSPRGHPRATQRAESSRSENSREGLTVRIVAAIKPTEATASRSNPTVWTHAGMVGHEEFIVLEPLRRMELRLIQTPAVGPSAFAGLNPTSMAEPTKAQTSAAAT